MKFILNKLLNQLQQLKRSSSSGFSLIEVMVSAGVLGAAIYLGSVGINTIGEKNKTVKNDSALGNTIYSMVNSIRSNIALEKVNYVAGEFLTENDIEKLNDLLPLAWNSQKIVPKAECSDCPGRIGYVISPATAGGIIFRGLFQVTVRITHTELLPGASKNYYFLVNGK